MNNRSVCPRCGGLGEITYLYDDNGPSDTRECTECDGQGSEEE